MIKTNIWKKKEFKSFKINFPSKEIENISSKIRKSVIMYICIYIYIC